MMLARLLAAPSPLHTRRGIDIDFPLLAGCLALLGLGLVMIASASSEVAAVQSGNPLYHMIRHLIYLAIGLGAALVTLLVPMALWQRYSGMLLLAAVVLLILVLLPGIGREVNGAKRWIGLGVFNLQPSELAKLFTVLFLAGYLVRRQAEVREKLIGFLKPLAVLEHGGQFLAQGQWDPAVLRHQALPLLILKPWRRPLLQKTRRLG